MTIKGFPLEISLLALMATLTFTATWAFINGVFTHGTRMSLLISGMGLGGLLHLLLFLRDSKLGPEEVGKIVAFLVPRRIRTACFEPYFEEMKADRLEALAICQSREARIAVEYFFYFRLTMTLCESLICYFTDTLGKALPAMKSFFSKGS